MKFAKVLEVEIFNKAIAIGWITGRNAGRVRFVESEVTLRTDDLKKAEKVTTNIEKKVTEKLDNIERVVIHAEPEPSTHILCALPLANESGDFSQHFGEAPFFALLKIRLKDKQVEHQEIKPNPFTRVEKGKGIKTAEWLIERKVDQVFLKEKLQGKGPEYVFDNAGVEMSITDKDTLHAVVEHILNETT